MPSEFSSTAWSPRFDTDCKTQPQTLGSPVEGAVGADLRVETLFLIKRDTGPLVCRFSSAPEVQQRGGGGGGAAAGENYEGDDETSIAEPTTSCRRRSGRNSQTKQVASTHTIKPDNDTKFIVLIMCRIDTINTHTFVTLLVSLWACVCVLQLQEENQSLRRTIRELQRKSQANERRLAVVSNVTAGSENI